MVLKNRCGMKRLIIVIMLSIPLALSAQTTYKESLQKIYDNYLKKQGFTTVEISKDMLTAMGVEDGIDSMTAISTEDVVALPQFCEDVLVYLSQLKQLMSFVNDGKRVQICASPGRTTLSIFTQTDTSAVLITLTGSDIKIETATSMFGGEKSGKR